MSTGYYEFSYVIKSDLLSVQNGIDFHEAGEAIDTEYADRGLVNTGTR